MALRRLPSGPDRSTSAERSAAPVAARTSPSAMVDASVRLPVQPLTAMAVLRLIRDPEASGADLARLVEVDPALSATVIRAANAPHLGVCRRVTSARQAVVLLGVKTVGSLAASGTASLVFTEDEHVAPVGFWAHSLATAAASAAIARRIEVPSDDAFSAGLLHDIGLLVFHRRDPVAVADLAAGTGRSPRQILDQEMSRFGRSHTDAGADLLDRWNFPDVVVRAVRSHHAAIEAVPDPLARCVLIGHALVAQLTDTPGRTSAGELKELLHVIGMGGERPAALAQEVARELAQVAGFLAEEAA